MKKGEKKAKRKSRNWDRDRDCGGGAGGEEEVLQQGAVGPEDNTLLHHSLSLYVGRIPRLRRENKHREPMVNTEIIQMGN